MQEIINNTTAVIKDFISQFTSALLDKMTLMLNE